MSSYRWLVRESIMVDKRRSAMIALLEFASSASNLGAVLLLVHGLRLIDRTDSVDGGLLGFLGGIVDPKFATLAIIGAASAGALYLGALVSMKAAEMARTVAREYQIRLMRRLLRDFANAPPGSLELSASQRNLLASNFAVGPRICGMAAETILRMLRPLSLIVIFGAAIVYLAWWLLPALVAITALTLPFLFPLYRNTAHHSSRIYGEERKAALQGITALVGQIDRSARSGPDLEAEVMRALDENREFPRILESYDFRKLSSNRGQYLATTGRAITTQLLILVLAAMALIGTSITWPSIIGLLLAGMRLQDAVYNALVRALALSRFFPVVGRMRAFRAVLEGAVPRPEDARAADAVSPGVGHRVLLVSRTPLLKSTLGHHLETLRGAKLLAARGAGAQPRVRTVQQLSPPSPRLGELLDRLGVERQSAEDDAARFLPAVLGLGGPAEVGVNLDTSCKDLWGGLDERSRILLVLLDALRDADLIMVALPKAAGGAIDNVLMQWLANVKSDIVVLSRNEPADTSAYGQVILDEEATLVQADLASPDEGDLEDDDIDMI